MDFSEAIRSGFQRYFDFSSRSCRSEYWFWILFILIGSIAFSLADYVTGDVDVSEFGPLENLFALGTIVPWLAVSVRRLHDINRSGWWLLLAIIPIVGWIILLVWAAIKGPEGANQFGENPLAAVDPMG